MFPVLLVVLFLAACRAGAQAPSDVPAGHWAYDAVRSLVEEGYMEGYRDGSFLGSRPLTRYEFATVIKRIVDGMAGQMVCKASDESAGPGQAAVPAGGVKPEDLAVVKKLIEEFKPELAVIGVRIDRIEAAADEVKSELNEVKAILKDEQAALQAARADVSKLKKVAVSGYVQARYNVFQKSFDSVSKDASDNFSIRRARIKVVGKPTDKSAVTLQIDAGQGAAGDKSPSLTTKDAYLEYFFAGAAERGLALQMGQMKWPFGYEVPQSSTARETPERALAIQRLLPGERDRGLVVSAPLNSKWHGKLGLFNGNEAKFGDANNSKDAVGALRFDFGGVSGGISGYYGRGVVDEAGGLYLQNNSRKWRYGADVQCHIKRLAFTAEYVAGKGVDGMKAEATSTDALSTKVDGGYVQAAFSATALDTVVAKYETLSLDVKYPSYGRRSALNLGLIRRLDDKTRFKAFYQVNNEETNEFDNDQFTFEWITTF